jgi:hypothetical protein
MEGPLQSVDTLDAAILSRLVAGTGRWIAYDDEALTEAERHADEYLIACGFFRVEICATVDNCSDGKCLELSAIATGRLTRDALNQFVLHYCPWCLDGRFTHEVEIRWWLSRLCRTTTGEQAAEMVASGASSTVLYRVRGCPPLPPEIVLIKRQITSKSSSGTVATAQAIATTGDVTQSVHQPITVNNHIDLAPITDLIKTAVGSHSREPLEGVQGKARATGAGEEPFVPMLRRCYRQAYEAYCTVLEALTESGVEPTQAAVWAYVKDTPITLRDGTQYQPPARRKTFEDYYNRVLNEARRASDL